MTGPVRWVFARSDRLGGERHATVTALMTLDARDELAARIAALLDAGGDGGTAAIARRAYDLAEALLRERVARDFDERDGAGLVGRTDPRLDAPPHDPAWEVEPRWSRADRASLEDRLARLGPGLAAVRPSDVPDERTGT